MHQQLSRYRQLAAQIGGYCVLAAYQPQSLSVIGMLACRIPYRRSFSYLAD